MDRCSVKRVSRPEAPTSRPIGQNPMQPLAEGPTLPCATGRRYRSWKGKGDDEVLAIVNLAVKENGLTSRRGLWGHDAGMADRIRARGLWERVEFCDADPGPSGKAKRRPLKAPPAPKSRENEGEEAAAEPALSTGLAKEDVLFLAQTVIDDGGLACMEELAVIDPEIHEAIRNAGMESGLRFALKEQKPDAESGTGTVDAVGPECNGRRENAPHLDEESMYRMICSECFRIGTPTPLIGGCRSTIPQLQASMHRNLGGVSHKLFRKCWDRMAAEGAIMYNSSGTAASLNPYGQVRDEKLRNALGWAAKEQVDAGMRRNALGTCQVK